MRRLTWEEFDGAVAFMAAALQGAGHVGVYGIPRGGLCLAVALSHALGIPLLQKPQPGCLVVDEVFESGRTMRAVRDAYEGVDCVVWMMKGVPDSGIKFFQAAHPSEWLTFPWESADNALTDQEDYHASR